MTFDEFVALLDPKNVYREYLISTFERDFRKGRVLIETKDERIVDVVNDMKSKRLFPVVDKRLGLIFGCETHDLPRTELYRYFYHARRMDLPYIEDCETRWITEGRGYFISKMRPGVIVVGEKYRTDKFDDLLFPHYRLDPQDMSLERWQREVRSRYPW